MDNSVLGLALGFVVGVLIYLSASHLLPEVKEHGKKHAYWAFLIGILLGIVIFLSKK
jgi:zinc transporter ZupT